MWVRVPPFPLSPQCNRRMERVRIDKLLFKEPVTAGLNLGRICIFAEIMRTSNEDPGAVLLRPEGEYFRIMDGRHRVVAAMMAGRKDVLAEFEAI